MTFQNNVICRSWCIKLLKKGSFLNRLIYDWDLRQLLHLFCKSVHLESYRLGTELPWDAVYIWAINSMEGVSNWFQIPSACIQPDMYRLIHPDRRNTFLWRAKSKRRWGIWMFFCLKMNLNHNFAHLNWNIWVLVTFKNKLFFIRTK